MSNAEMEKIVEGLYEVFDAKGKLEDAASADQIDLEELKTIEGKIKASLTDTNPQHTISNSKKRKA